MNMFIDLLGVVFGNVVIMVVEGYNKEESMCVYGCVYIYIDVYIFIC